ncbi:MAG: methyltransferase domain-containing protein [Cellvibrionaceae bacterium]
MSKRRPPMLPKRKTIPVGTDEDRNFDDLAHRFKRNVYDHLKGDIRLAVLQRDLRRHLSSNIGFGEKPQGRNTESFTLHDGDPATDTRRELNILDAGGGQGQFSLSLAAQGHRLTICDISGEMLSLAKKNAEQLGVTERVTFIHGPIQSYCEAHQQQFDLVLCHAVLEWVVEPQALLQVLVGSLKEQGYLSLTYYNVNSIKMKNLLRTNFKKVLDDDYQGYRGSLTPTFPRAPEEVGEWFSSLPLERLCESGIRCFHDYILEPDHRLVEPDQQLALELRLSSQEPWRSLARYIHVLSKRSLA